MLLALGLVLVAGVGTAPTTGGPLSPPRATIRTASGAIPVYLSCGDGDAGPHDPTGPADRIEAALIAQNQALVAELRIQGATRLTTLHEHPDDAHGATSITDESWTAVELWLPALYSVRAHRPSGPGV